MIEETRKGYRSALYDKNGFERINDKAVDMVAIWLKSFDGHERSMDSYKAAAESLINEIFMAGLSNKLTVRKANFE